MSRFRLNLVAAVTAALVVVVVLGMMNFVTGQGSATKTVYLPRPHIEMPPDDFVRGDACPEPETYCSGWVDPNDPMSTPLTTPSTVAPPVTIAENMIHGGYGRTPFPD